MKLPPVIELSSCVSILEASETLVAPSKDASLEDGTVLSSGSDTFKLLSTV